MNMMTPDLRLARLRQIMASTYEIGAVMTPHTSNILTKLGRPDARHENKLAAFDRLIPSYVAFRNTTIDPSEPLSSRFNKLVASVNNYFEVLRLPECRNVFSRQSDFSSSVIPELFFLIFQSIIQSNNLPYSVSSQKDVIVDCMFDSYQNGRLLLKKKSIDVAILQPCQLSFNGILRSDFFIPLVALEIKTNLDKNMISGIEHSVETLKRTFPNSLYLAVAEYSDFAIDRQNYATTYIDEIYILRKQKRAAVRTGMIEPNVISIELLYDLAIQIEKHLITSSGAVPSLQDRMNTGSLIKRRGN